MHALLEPEVQSKVSGKVTFVGRKKYCFSRSRRGSLITVWLKVRVLPAPPRIHGRTEISRTGRERPRLAALRESDRSPRSIIQAGGRFCPLLSLLTKSGFPATETRRTETPVRM